MRPSLTAIPGVATLSRARIPIWMESRFAVERAALMRSGLMRPTAPDSNGAPVLLIPGFLAGDGSMTLMAKWLRALGYEACRAQIRANVDCTARALDRLERQLEQAAERHGRPVAIVGQSRGGSMARILAVRRPDLVEGIACLGSPLTDMFAVHPLVHTQIHLVGALGSLGVPGVFSRGCRWGDCCETVRREAESAVPAGVAFLSVYSRSDGIVDWRACLDPQAVQAEVNSSHCGMSVNPDVYRVVGSWLAARQSLAAAPAEPRRLAIAA